MRRKSDAAWCYDHGSGDARIMNEGGRPSPKATFPVSRALRHPKSSGYAAMKPSDIATAPIARSARAAGEAGATTRLHKRAGPRLYRIPFQDHIIPKVI
jgi:hypothetical protein